jgi:hypothetical protein
MTIGNEGVRPTPNPAETAPIQPLNIDLSTKPEQDAVFSRWREIRACIDNACGEAKRHNSHESLLDYTFLIAATDPKALIY